MGKEQRREEGQKEGFTTTLLSLRYHDFPWRKDFACGGLYLCARANGIN